MGHCQVPHSQASDISAWVHLLHLEMVAAVQTDQVHLSLFDCIRNDPPWNQKEMLGKGI